MISLYDAGIADILPENFKKMPEVKALSYALQNLNQKILRYVKKVNIFLALDEQDDSVLDLLGLEMQIPYYDSGMERLIKIDLIRNALLWNMYAGTPDCVERLINTIFDSGQVVEWFENEGDPGTFIIEINNDLVTPDAVKQLGKIIKRSKNVRSHLTGVTANHDAEQMVYIVGRTHVTDNTIIT